jgi:hypothetical protein
MSEQRGRDSREEILEQQAYEAERRRRAHRPTRCGDCPGPVVWCTTCEASRCWNAECPARDAVIDPDGAIRCAVCRDELAEAVA